MNGISVWVAVGVIDGIKEAVGVEVGGFGIKEEVRLGAEVSVVVDSFLLPQAVITTANSP